MNVAPTPMRADNPPNAPMTDGAIPIKQGKGFDYSESTQP